MRRVGVVLAGFSGCVGRSQQDVCGGGGVAGAFCVGRVIRFRVVCVIAQHYRAVKAAVSFVNSGRGLGRVGRLGGGRGGVQRLVDDIGAPFLRRGSVEGNPRGASGSEGASTRGIRASLAALAAPDQLTGGVRNPPMMMGPGQNAALQPWAHAFNATGGGLAINVEGLDDFDFLAVNGRGIQLSNPLNITSGVFFNNLPFAFPSTQNEFDHYQAAIKNFYTAATRDSTPPGIMNFVGSKDIVQDWDAMRAALGYDKRSTSSSTFYTDSLPTELTTFSWQRTPKSTLVIRHGDHHTSVPNTGPSAAAGDIARNFLRTGVMPGPHSDTQVTIIPPGGQHLPIPRAYNVPTGAIAGDESTVENIV
ncbi:hypothetical protein B0H14DRAFT_3558540 [Mycena olivaceomarginata]|nr:hypothetical protein B0H14DRAFT_3558540 [Mycena olivaceomarginata]